MQKRTRCRDPDGPVTATANGDHDTTIVLMDYTQEQIERIAEFASDAANLKPAGPEAWEWGRQAGDAIADTFTDEDWETLLNRLSP